MALELESLIIRLIGDGSSYAQMLKEAQRQTSQFIKDINKGMASAGGGSGAFTKLQTGFQKISAKISKIKIKPNIDLDGLARDVKKAEKIISRITFQRDRRAGSAGPVSFRMSGMASRRKLPTAIPHATEVVPPHAIPVKKPPAAVPVSSTYGVKPDIPKLQPPPGVSHVIGKPIPTAGIPPKPLDLPPAQIKEFGKKEISATSGSHPQPKPMKPYGLLPAETTADDVKEMEKASRNARLKAARAADRESRDAKRQAAREAAGSMKTSGMSRREIMEEAKDRAKARKEKERADEENFLRESRRAAKQAKERRRLEQAEKKYHGKQLDKLNAERDKDARKAARQMRLDALAQARQAQNLRQQRKARQEKEAAQGAMAAKRISAKERKREAERELADRNRRRKEVIDDLNKLLKEQIAKREKARKLKEKQEQQEAQRAVNWGWKRRKARAKREQQEAQRAINWDYRQQRRAERQEQRAVQAAINYDFRQREKAAKMRAKAERDEIRHRSKETRFNRQRNQERIEAGMTAASRGMAAGAIGTAGLGAIIGGGSLAMTKASIEAFAGFDLQMTKSISIMEDLSEETRKSMESVAIDLSTKGVQSADQLAQGYYYLASAGYKAADAIKLLPTVQNFATAGAFDLAKATSLAADSQASLGMKVKDVEQNMRNLKRITDVLAKADTLANASIEQFAISLSRQAGAALKSYSKEVEEGVAVLAAMADQGIKAEYAGTQLSILLRYLGKTAVKEKDAHKAYGLAVFDSAGNMRHLGDIIENLEQILGPMSDELRAATLLQMGFEARMQQAILPLIGASQRIKEYYKELQTAGDFTEQIAKKQMMAFTNQLIMLKNEIMATAIAIGKELAPIVMVFAQGIKAAVQFTRQLNPALAASVLIIGIVTGAVFGLVSATLALGAAIFAAGATFNVMFGGIGIVIGATVAAATVLWGTLAAIGAASVTGGVLGLIQLFGGFKKVLEDVKKFASDVWERIAPMRKALQSLFTLLYDAAVITFEKIKTFVAQTWQSMIDDMAVDWDEVIMTITVGIYAVEYALAHSEHVGRLLWSMMSYELTKLGNEFLYWFRDALPHVINVAMRHTMDQVKIAVQNAIKYVENGIANLSVVITHLDALLHGKIRFSNLFMKPLDDGLKAFETLGITLPERVIGKNEQKWADEIEHLVKELGPGFEQFLMKKLVDRGPDILKPVVDEAKAAGKRAGDHLADGLEKGLDRFDIALFDSAEAYTRMQEHAEGVLGGGGRNKKDNIPVLPRKVNVMGDMDEIMSGNVKAGAANVLPKVIPDTEKLPMPFEEIENVEPDWVRRDISPQNVDQGFNPQQDWGHLIKQFEMAALSGELVKNLLDKIASNTSGFNGVRFKTGVLGS